MDSLGRMVGIEVVGGSVLVDIWVTLELVAACKDAQKVNQYYAQV